MLKTLLKKQLWEMTAFLYQDRKNGKRRSGGSLVLYALLMLYVFAALGFMFFVMAQSLCAPLVELGQDWLYFALMGTMATLFGVVGSVFSTYSGLYQAKDNELLLSMPVPPRNVLFVRMMSIYVMTFVFEALALVPAELVYAMEASPSAAAVVFGVLILFLLPLFALSLSCILGWVVALFAGRMRNKSLVTVVLSLAFLVLYYYFYSQAYRYLQMILANLDVVGNTIHSALYPLYLMGRGAQGDVLAFLGFAGMVAVFFAIVYFVLARSFLKLATMKRGAAKVRYEEKALKVASQERALLRREFSRFWSSPTYMMNCGLGAILLVAGAVLVVVKAGVVRDYLSQIPELAAFAPLLACGAIGLVSSMNVLTAPSISLEGKTLWLVQSLPVRGWDVLKSKLCLHMYVSAIPAVLCAVALDAVLKPGFLMAVLLPVFSVVFILLCGAFGLFMNLKLPNLHWTNEAVAVKQSASVVIAMFGSWAILILLLALAYAATSLMSQTLSVLCCTVAAALVSWLLLRWLKTRGEAILAAL